MRTLSTICIAFGALLFTARCPGAEQEHSESFSRHPLDFLQRFDRNQNGMLDAEEQVGPVRHLLTTLRRDVSWLPSDGRPVSIRGMIAVYDRRREERARDAFVQPNGEMSKQSGPAGSDDDSPIKGFGADVPGFGEAVTFRGSKRDLRDADLTLFSRRCRKLWRRRTSRTEICGTLRIN